MDFRVFFWTTTDISEPSFAKSILAEIDALADGTAEVLDATGEDESWRQRTAVEDELLGRIYETGGFNVRAHSDQVGCQVDWRRFDSLEEFERFVSHAGYLQNGLFLTVSPSLLDEPFAERLLAVVRRLCTLTRANLLYAVGADSANYRLEYDFRLHVGVGLRDVYPINYFGAVYRDLIGDETFRALPAELVEEVGEGFLVLPLRDYWRADPARMAEKRAAIRAAIGEEFFSTGGERRAGVETGCALGLFAALWRERRRFEDRSILAQRRPQFDWSPMIGSSEP